MAEDFKQTQDELDRAQWQGVGWRGELPGGGNADSDSDHDPIESHYKQASKTIGPEGLLPKGNSTK